MQPPAHLLEISPQINPYRVHSGCVIDVIPGLTCDQLSLILLQAPTFLSTSHQLTANQKAGSGVSPGLAPLMLKQHDGTFISFERIIIVCYVRICPSRRWNLNLNPHSGSFPAVLGEEVFMHVFLSFHQTSKSLLPSQRLWESSKMFPDTWTAEHF